MPKIALADRVPRHVPPRMRVLELERGKPFAALLIDAYDGCSTLLGVAADLKVARSILYDWLALFDPPVTNEDLTRFTLDARKAAGTLS